MTQDEARKWGELFLAFADGKQIQYDDGEEWIVDNLQSVIKEKENVDYYRIKPEPKYVPYTWDDWKEFMMKKVVNKKSKKVYIVIGVQKKNIEIDTEDENDWEWPSYEKAFAEYMFADGTPFGKLIED